MNGQKKAHGLSMGFQVTLVVGVIMVLLFSVVFAVTSTRSGKMVEKSIDDSGLGFIQSLQTSVAQEITALGGASESFVNIVVQQLQGKRIFEKEEIVKVGDTQVKQIFILDGGLKAVTGNQTMVEDWAKAMGSAFSIFQITDQGLVRVATTVKGADGELLLGDLLDKSGEIWRTTVDNGEVYREMVWLGGLPYAGCYKGVSDVDGKIRIVIFSGSPLDNAEKRVMSSSLGQGSYGLVFDGSGSVITHPKLERGTSIKKEIPSFMEACAQNGVFGKTEPMAISYHYGGRESRGYLQKIAGTDWYVMVVVDADLVLAPVKSLKKGLLLWTLPLIVAGLFVLGLVVMRIVRPLGKVVEVADHIAKADLSVRVSGKEGNRNEIEKVMVAFGRIVEEYKQMVAKVKAMNVHFDEACMSMRDIAQEVNQALSEVEKSAGEVAQMSDSIAASAEETNAGVAELSTGAAAASGVVTELSEKAHSVSTGADTGRGAVDEVTSRTAQVGEASRRVVTAIGELEKSVGGISGFVNTIVSIADQTNLLALNAAIEAARAGEAGRGFAVVAEEVRKLAEESNHAASNIRNVIEQIQTDMTVAAKDSRDAGAVMEELLEKSNQAASEIGDVTKGVASMAEGIQTIAASSEEQTAGTQEIARAVDNIASMLNRGRESARNTKEAVDRMGQKLQELDKIRMAQDDRVEELRDLTAPYRLEEHKALEG